MIVPPVTRRLCHRRAPSDAAGANAAGSLRGADERGAPAPGSLATVDPREKAGLSRVRVFSSVARRFDLMNDLMSGGVHRLWKDAAAARLNPQPGETIIDCAGGTGDMARRFCALAEAARTRRGGDETRVVVIDYNHSMIEAGRARPDASSIVWTVGDAQALPVADACADAYSIAFGLRNVTDTAAALREARRVLRPGGRFLCLEFSRPTVEAIRRVYDAYSFRVIPVVGGLVARDRDSYRYLVESIRRFPDQKRLAGLIGEAGFSRVSVTNFSGGVCALHQGWAI